MKAKYLVISLASLIALSGCSLTPHITPSSQESSTSESQSSSSPKESSSSESSSESSSQESSESSSTESQDRNFSIYSLNDFHGSIKPLGSEAGILKIGSFFKEKKAEGNTLLINAGDMFQGSVLSNSNRGNCLMDITNYIQFDSFTLGNHEFDWGQKYIKELRARKDSVTYYQTPFICANIYKYDEVNSQRGEFDSDLCDEYTIKVLDNGLKVGIIGAIGTSQWTSITSTNVNDVEFVDFTSIVKNISRDLKDNKGCDAVILSVHEEQSKVDNSITNYYDSNLTKRYVDAVLCAHSHAEESQVVNGVPFLQAGSNGKYYGNIEMQVSASGEVSFLSYNYTSALDIEVTYDSKISQIIASYEAEIPGVAEEVLSYTNGTFYANNQIPCLVCDAIGAEAKKQGYDIAYAVSNKSRASIYSGTLTYETLFKAIPFDNEVYILDVTADSLANELTYTSNYFTRYDNKAIDYSKTYRIAVIDYLAVHKGVNRQYNYFPGFTFVAKLSKVGQDIYHYRDITSEYLRANFLSGINAADYNQSLDQHNRSLIKEDI